MADPASHSPSLREFVTAARQRTQGLRCIGLPDSAKAHLLAVLAVETGQPVCVVTPTIPAAERLAADLAFFAGELDVDQHYFTPYALQPYKLLAYHNETAARRLATLYQLTHARRSYVLVTSLEALVHKLIPRETLVDFAELVMENEELDRDALIAKMVAGGYERTPIVEEPGDFSVRGGIVDLFCPLYPEPVRIELFGDFVESIRFFSAATQRTLRSVAEITVLPAREALVPKSRVNVILQRMREQAAVQELPISKLRDLVERFNTEGMFAGIEGLLPLIYERLDTLADYLPDQVCWVLDDPSALSYQYERVQRLLEQNHASALADQNLCVPPDRLTTAWPEIEAAIAPKSPLLLEAVDIRRSEDPLQTDLPTYHFRFEESPAARFDLVARTETTQRFSAFLEVLQNQVKMGRTIYLVGRTRAQLDRLQGLLDYFKIPFQSAANFMAPAGHGTKGGLRVVQGEVSAGFVWPVEGFGLVTDPEIYGTRRRKRAKSRKRAADQLLNFGELSPGDLVVHVDHGIGRYEGLEQLALGYATSDFLLLTYQDQDKLYLPVDRLDMIQKYMGVEGVAPILDKMGGRSWLRIKEKVRQSAEKIAGELLSLYATRKVVEGYQFSDGGQDFREFQADFPFEETHDQHLAIDDVLSDMEASTPMDRLICGDVGYGKTEVALRAAFVAAHNGRQIAMLVPTTVLAEQHYANFKTRFERYPITLACLSRFRKPAEQRRIVEGLKSGGIDIVIGTHRLLQKDVGFKSLGLIILDEEQRFGVKHKERLKKMRSNVDVLALTATPIPRTLHLSLMGVRDISVIATPPAERQAIMTYISEFDDHLIVDAINRERERGGQLFFVHNHVQSIDRMAAHIQSLVPDVRLDVAHGQMEEKGLEEVMVRFLNQDIDLLVCTTIIESGLDIPAANTILINRADRFGLSQIYQLRGRVGRSDEQAYAYLFIPKDTQLTKDAQKRLKVLMEYNDLGAGFQIAMNDLKIRGGGTILGASQSGHIAAVGYDMFLKLMETAISEMKGQPQIEALEPEVNLSLSARIPESYLPQIDQRLLMYRRLSRIENVSEINEIKTELVDRYGPAPDEVRQLLFKIMLKLLCRDAGVKRLDATAGQMNLHFSEAHQKNPLALIDLVNQHPRQFQFTPEQTLVIKLSNSAQSSALGQMKNILKQISQHVNSGHL